MGYRKIIRSAELVEEWVFARDLPDFDKQSQKRSRSRQNELRRNDNINRCKKAFSRLVRANLDQIPAFCTLTMHEIVPVSEAYKAYSQFSLSLRRKFGNEYKAIAVPEFQKRGAVHFHVLIWGLPSTLPCIRSKRHSCPKSQPCERKTRYLAKFWKHGFLDLVETDGSPKLSTYMSKYMGKAMHDPRLVTKRAYSSSHNVNRPVVLNKPSHIDIAFDMWDLSTGDCVVKYRTYDTLFLGRCDYKQHVIKN